MEGENYHLDFDSSHHDEEIVFQYLAHKTFSHPLPPLLIPEIDVSTFDPWELPGNSDQDKYFFSNKEGNARRNGDRISRGTCSGHWKATGSTKRIICSKRMPIVGIRKSLVFYKGKSPRACRTDWIMHEYFIALSGNMDCDMQQKKNSQVQMMQPATQILVLPHHHQQLSSTLSFYYS
ncbi:UNVERIFIED_CONTAM: NAC domain-containing protein 83 [Sesamum angustifolium]|uniref:NAC domain-containing protein 83 n=1 Tax=Sesamum angustifolium TaxID=2727405 RepID=A0AAW2RIR9_9LAMI